MQVHFYMHSCMPPARGQCLKSATSAAVQARAVCDGLPGDIVALALPLDIAKIAEAGLINPDWQARPARSAPRPPSCPARGARGPCAQHNS